MRTALPLLAFVCSLALAQSPRLVENWREAYAGDDATGKHVIALWHFDPGAELKDASGHGHDLTLRGGKPVPEGRLGGGLESSRGWSEQDEAHGASAANSHGGGADDQNDAGPVRGACVHDRRAAHCARGGAG